ncbi:MAG: XRE family transcriptional regulator [Prevotellaceae bacterium]|nr:XRE family transcriptional regulator [Prevotellaceae bacterium]
MGVKERIREYIKYKGISERKFCEMMGGVSLNCVNSIRKSIQTDKLKRITAAFPELNPIWILTGEGEMLIDKSGNNISLTGDNMMGNTSVTGSGNNVNTDYNGAVLRMPVRYQEIIREKDLQTGRLISIIEVIQGKPLKMKNN